MSDRRMFLQLMSASSTVLGQAESVLFDLLMDQWWSKVCCIVYTSVWLVLMLFSLTTWANLGIVNWPLWESLRWSPLPARKYSLEFLEKSSIYGLMYSESSRKLKTKLHSAKRPCELNNTLFRIYTDIFVTFTSDEPPSPTNLHRFWELDKPPASYFHETDGTPEYGRRQAVSINHVVIVQLRSIFSSQVYDQDPIRVTQLVPFVGSQIREAEANCGPANFKVYLDRTDSTVLKQIQDILARG